jgi:NDP-sugar pyrophosphorylase family protein
MKVPDLFSADLEPVLNAWIRKFTSLEDLFSALPQLYAGLTSPTIEGRVEETTLLSGPVHIASGAVVHAQAIIHGPCIVGPGAVINSHTEIRSGYIGSQCVIGHSASIVQSMVMNNTKIGAGAFIRNSVIGFASVVGPGVAIGPIAADRASTANSHSSSTPGAFLGDYAVVGANSTIKSGTIIGTRTIVGEGVLTSGIYESNQIVTLIPTLDIKARHKHS